MERLRTFVPPPHEWVQPDQVENSETSQWVGQLPRLQCFVSDVEPAGLPPHDSSLKVRVRDILPLPHDLVQELSLPQEPGCASTGQQYSLQLRTSLECGQAAPPLLGCVWMRERICVPPIRPSARQDLLHSVQAPHALVTQPLAHGATLQDRVSSKNGHT
jgi:hypothetical protein